MSGCWESLAAKQVTTDPKDTSTFVSVKPLKSLRQKINK